MGRKWSTYELETMGVGNANAFDAIKANEGSDLKDVVHEINPILPQIEGENGLQQRVTELVEDVYVSEYREGIRYEEMKRRIDDLQLQNRRQNLAIWGIGLGAIGVGAAVINHYSAKQARLRREEAKRELHDEAKAALGESYEAIHDDLVKKLENRAEALKK